MPKQKVLGINVSKSWLDLDSRDTGAWRERNNDQRVKAILRAVDRHHISLMVLEATGGHERDLAHALVRDNVSVSVVNPRQARDFAKSLGLIAKPMLWMQRYCEGMANSFLSSHTLRHLLIWNHSKNKRTTPSGAFDRPRKAAATFFVASGKTDRNGGHQEPSKPSGET